MNETSVVGERDVCLKVWTAWRVDGSRIASRWWRGDDAGVGTWFWRAPREDAVAWARGMRRTRSPEWIDDGDGGRGAVGN